MLNRDSRVVASSTQVSAELQNESVILEVNSGKYFGLNPVGARIWQLIQQPVTVEIVCNTILSEYDVDPAKCEADVLRLLDQLTQVGLVSVEVPSA